jgi:hypothetical protein
MKYFSSQSLYGHKNVFKEEIGSNEEFSGAELASAWKFGSLFVSDIIFSKNC